MDDFGTGYSSLGYLRTYPFDSIKIDKRLRLQHGETGRDRSIVQAIITLDNALNPAGHRRGRGDRRADAYPARRAMPRTGRFLLSRPLMRSACAIC
ncbi:EAL domain-containing protein [Pseudomonas aeruginosa]|nr:EAL domain-containing protein [Pseudomonas aeruginosa]